MSNADYLVRDNPDKSRFETMVDGHLAIAEYRLPEGSILFSHTDVPEMIEGRGVAKALAKAALASARERGLKVIPLCTFFAGYIKRHPEEQDLLHPDYRRVLGLE
jgi:predicted GNAT family acetyltransferase